MSAIMKFDKLSDQTREKLLTLGPDIDKYWDRMIRFFQLDPQGQVYAQLIACYIRRSTGLEVAPIGYPIAHLIGFSDGKGKLGSVKVEYGVIGNDKPLGSGKFSPVKPTDLGIEICSYFGRYYGLFKPGQAISEKSA